MYFIYVKESNSDEPCGLNSVNDLSDPCGECFACVLGYERTIIELQKELDRVKQQNTEAQFHVQRLNDQMWQLKDCFDRAIEQRDAYRAAFDRIVVQSNKYRRRSNQRRTYLKTRLAKEDALRLLKNIK